MFEVYKSEDDTPIGSPLFTGTYEECREHIRNRCRGFKEMPYIKSKETGRLVSWSL